MIRPAVNWAISTLATLKETTEPLQKLQVDINLITRISDNLQPRKDTGRQLETMLMPWLQTSKIALEIRQRSLKPMPLLILFCSLQVTKTASKNMATLKWKLLPITSFHEMKITWLNCFASGHKSSSFSLVGNCKYQLETKAVPFSCPSCWKTKAFSTTPCLKSCCLLLKLGSPYPVAMPGQREEVVLSTTPTQSFATIQGVKLTFFSSSHLAPKYFTVVANSKKLVAIMTHEKKKNLPCHCTR